MVKIIKANIILFSQDPADSSEPETTERPKLQIKGMLHCPQCFCKIYFKLSLFNSTIMVNLLLRT